MLLYNESCDDRPISSLVCIMHFYNFIIKWRIEEKVIFEKKCPFKSTPKRHNRTWLWRCMRIFLNQVTVNCSIFPLRTTMHLVPACPVRMLSLWSGTQILASLRKGLFVPRNLNPLNEESKEIRSVRRATVAGPQGWGPRPVLRCRDKSCLINH